MVILVAGLGQGGVIAEHQVQSLIRAFIYTDRTGLNEFRRISALSVD